MRNEHRGCGALSAAAAAAGGGGSGMWHLHGRVSAEWCAESEENVVFFPLLPLLPITPPYCSTGLPACVTFPKQLGWEFIARQRGWEERKEGKERRRTTEEKVCLGGGAQSSTNLTGNTGEKPLTSCACTLTSWMWMTCILFFFIEERKTTSRENVHNAKKRKLETTDVQILTC